MLFRKYALRYGEIKVIAFISSIFYCVFLIYLYVRCLREDIYFGSEAIILLISAFLMIWFLLWEDFKEFILIDETGISCYKSNRLEWKYTWHSIAKLKRGSYYKWPGVAILLYDKKGIPEKYEYSGRNFHLCRTAKEALEKYYYSQGKNLE